jgi:hypothetical protein
VTMLLGQTAGGSALASWRPVVVLLVVFGVILLALLTVRRDSPLVRRIPDNLERLTGIPGWAAATIGMALYGLLVAGQGFYSDVAWHVALGRDETLFTAPHTAIFLGLQFIFLAAPIAIWTATATKVDTPFRLGALRIPASALPLAALGTGAVLGFPLDEVWHKAYGVDVTMWSPTHMLMILGATFTGAAAWLVLGEAGVKPTDSRWARGVHVVASVLTLLGLSAPLGEFDFGVPQFQQIFHPILVSIAAAFALVAMRLVHGRWWTVGTVFVTFLMQSNVIGGEGEGPVDTRAPAIFVASAVCVELVAFIVGTTNRLRFALVSGLAVGTLGLAGEWAWNADAYQPWTANLLPDAVILSVIGALGAAVAGTAFARAVARDTATPGVPVWALGVALVAVVAVIVLPLPRKVGEVEASMRVIPTASGDEANVEVTLTPPDAADEARWFQATAWQGGGLVLSNLEETDTPGVWRTEKPVPITGFWKSLVRLHRGGEMMAMPVFLPKDVDIDEEEIPAVDRSGAFESEKTYLLRETYEGITWLAPVVHGLLALAAAVWLLSFVIAAGKLAPRGGGPSSGRGAARRVSSAKPATA